MNYLSNDKKSFLPSGDIVGSILKEAKERSLFSGQTHPIPTQELIKNPNLTQNDGY